MKFKFKKLSIVLILIYIACIIFTTYTLFQLQDNLIYESHSLNISELPSAQPIFINLYFVVGITLIFGLAALVVAFDSGKQEVIYVEKKKNIKSTDKNSESEDDEDANTLDLNTIKTILAKENDADQLAKELLTEICKQMAAGTGAFYKASKEKEKGKGKDTLILGASYALPMGESHTVSYEFGEGLIGQVAMEGKTLIIDDVPEGYIQIRSGLGSATPTQLLIVPIKHKNKLYGVVEIASFTALGKNEEKMVEEAFKQFAQGLAVLEGESKKTYPLKSKSAEDKKSISSKKRNKKHKI